MVINQLEHNVRYNKSLDNFKVYALVLKLKNQTFRNIPRKHDEMHDKAASTFTANKLKLKTGKRRTSIAGTPYGAARL